MPISSNSACSARLFSSAMETDVCVVRFVCNNSSTACSISFCAASFRIQRRSCPKRETMCLSTSSKAFLGFGLVQPANAKDRIPTRNIGLVTVMFVRSCVFAWCVVLVLCCARQRLHCRKIRLCHQEGRGKRITALCRLWICRVRLRQVRWRGSADATGQGKRRNSNGSHE